MGFSLLFLSPFVAAESPPNSLFPSLFVRLRNLWGNGLPAAADLAGTRRPLSLGTTTVWRHPVVVSLRRKNGGTSSDGELRPFSLGEKRQFLIPGR